MVGSDSPEEGQTRSESIDIHSGVYSGTQIFQTVGQGICQLDIGGSTCFLHVITGNRDRVELRHILGRIFEDIGDDLHREFRRVNIGITHHKFFQDIVLNGSGQLLQGSPLFQSGNNIESQDRKHGTVHGHRYGHLIQRDLIEQDLHVQDRVDSHTGFTDIPDHTRVVGVVSTVSSQVECHRQTFLSGSQIAAIESIRFFSGRESGILTDRPGTQRVHGRIRSTEIRRNSGNIIQMFHTFQIIGSIYRFHRNQLRGRPVFSDVVGFFPFSGAHGSLFRRFNIYIFKIRFHVSIVKKLQSYPLLYLIPNFTW